MEEVKKERSVIMQALFLILLLLAIVALIYATITVIRYKEMLSNPLGYNLEKFGLDYCVCVDNSGTNMIIPSINSNQTSQNIYDMYAPKENKYSDKVDLSKLNLTFTK
jgi:hypothetical protein